MDCCCSALIRTEKPNPNFRMDTVTQQFHCSWFNTLEQVKHKVSILSNLRSCNSFLFEPGSFNLFLSIAIFLIEYFLHSLSRVVNTRSNCTDITFSNVRNLPVFIGVSTCSMSSETNLCLSRLLTNEIDPFSFTTSPQQLLSLLLKHSRREKKWLARALFSLSSV